MQDISKMACPRKSQATAFRIINDEAVILNLDSSVYYTLNEVGARIWDLCDGTNNIENIAATICNEFEVTREIAFKDILELMNDLSQEGLITFNETFRKD